MAKKAHTPLPIKTPYSFVANDEVLTKSEAAELLHMCERTLMSKDIPHHCTGKRTLFLKSELFAWVASLDKSRERLSQW